MKVPALSIRWNALTLWALPAQLTGVPQLGWPARDLLYQYAIKAIAAIPSKVYGFPPLDLNVLGPCSDVSNPYCPTKDFIASLRSQPPSFCLGLAQLTPTVPSQYMEGFRLIFLCLMLMKGRRWHSILLLRGQSQGGASE